MIAHVRGRPSGAAFLFVRCPAPSRPQLSREQAHAVRNRADLRESRRRFRARRRLLADGDDGRALSRLRRRHRRGLARLFASAPGRGADDPGRQALAHVQSLSDAGGRASGAAADRGDLRRPGFLQQFGRRGQRGGGQDGAQAPVGRRPSREVPHPDFRRRLSRAHAGDDRRRRTGQVHRGFRAEGGRLRPDPGNRPRRRGGGDRPGNRRADDRADPGRRRRAGDPAGVSQGLARAVRQARPAADLRRNPDRRRSHRPAASPTSIPAPFPTS